VSDHDDLAVPGNEDALAVADDHSVGPVADPGLPAHEPRPTDVDEAMERRAERQVAGLFALAALLSVLFCVFYFAIDSEDRVFGYGAQNLALGLSLGLALLSIGAGAIQWAKKLMNDHEIVEMRHPAGSSPEDIEAALEAFEIGTADSGIGRRPLIRNTMIGALAMLGLPTIVLLRDLGPLPGRKDYYTVWRKGVRVVVDVSGTPLKPEDLVLDTLVNGEPALFFEQEGPNGEKIPAKYEGVELQNAKARASVIVVRMNPADIHPAPERKNWGVDGILCFSKICTHVGCPISLWEKETYHVLCPCHQSTFDLTDNGKVLFGPAARALPQLPLGVDSEGYLIAMSDFPEPIGPSFWERG
jgi:ubiquinol-cytochrome c reductase iron-sulfur subunit